VIFTLPHGGDASEFVSAIRQYGVLANAVGPRAVRLVTHLDVSREECQRAAVAVAEVLAGWGNK